MYGLNVSINRISQTKSAVRQFIVYLLIWVSSNLAIPFWVVGHIHLTLNIYQDIHEILMSFGMNIIVLIGFYLDYKKYKNEQTTNSKS